MSHRLPIPVAGGHDSGKLRRVTDRLLFYLDVTDGQRMLCRDNLTRSMGKEPHWSNDRLVARFRSVDACVERFPPCATENEQDFRDVASVIEGIKYDGFISSPRNNYQVNLTFDQCLVEKLRAI